MCAQREGLTGKDRNVFQAPMDVLTLTPEQIMEAMVVIPNDLWNVACWGC